MATVIEFTYPADEFPLGSIFENLPSVTVELERLIPHDSVIIPHFWVRGAEAEDIESLFEAHAGVSNIRLLDTVEDESLMRAEWKHEYAGVLSAIAETNLVVLSGVGTNDGWKFEVRGESREEISEFRTYCQEHDIPITITAVHELRPIHEKEYELTDAQREALVLSYERGYFDSPPEVTLEDVSKELGITQQSLSSRLRRGHQQLIAATLIDQ